VTSAGDTVDGGVGHGHDNDAMNSKPLSELTISEVERLLESIEFDEYKAVFVENKIDGKCLTECYTSDDAMNMGISIVVKARIFLKKVMTWKANGVPLEYLSVNEGTDQDDR